MAYCSASNILGYSKNLAGSANNFTEDTDPKLSQVVEWMSSGCAAIHSRLSSAGWSVPVASGTDLYDRLADLNALFAAGRAETSRINVTISPGERTRGQIFTSMFWDELNALVENDLTDMGGTTVTSDAQIYVGGIDVDDKDTYYDDDDRVNSRFKRNQFKFGDSIYPD